MSAGGDVLSDALALHRVGDLAAARALYDKVLRRAPDHPDALHLSGLALIGLGDDSGLKRLRKAVSRKPQEGAFRTSLVQALAQCGRWDEASSAALEFISKSPRDPAAARSLLALANAMYDAGRPDGAAPLYLRAQPFAPDSLELAYNYACCQRDLGRRAYAARAFAAALLCEPASSEALTQLAALAPDELRWLTRRLRVGPPHAEIACALAAARQQNGDKDGAWTACRLALALSPDLTGGWINASAIQASAGEADAALSAAARAVRLAPTDSGVWLCLGLRSSARGGGDAYRRAVALAPASPTALRNIASAFLAQSLFDAALAAADWGGAVADKENAAGLLSNRGVALMSVGRVSEAAAAFRAALDFSPHDLMTRSNLLFCLCFHAGAPLAEVYEAHRAYERVLPTVNHPVPPAPKSPDGRLRVGYVSPDFQRYPGPGFHFLFPLLDGHDRARFSITCYYTDATQDAVTARFQARADAWRRAATWSDEELARQVRDDGIDILVDCDGHMSRNRMAAFGRRMAPVQVSFPLYPNTTGLSAMDYQFGDASLTPPFMQDFRCEALVRLPGATLCYQPSDSDCAPPPVSPWETTGVFTFASFNNLAKMNAATVAAWSEILKQAPGARLLLKWRGLFDGVAARILDQFSAQGVARDRLTLMGTTADPYEAYAHVDLCLDPLFAAGGTTSCDALWMGVPVLTLPGRSVIGRWGASLLSALSLEDAFVADSVADYVARAVAFAGQPATLSAARDGLRARMRASPLMDQPAYVRGVEDAYVEMWRRFEVGERPTPFDVAAL